MTGGPGDRGRLSDLDALVGGAGDDDSVREGCAVARPWPWRCLSVMTANKKKSLFPLLTAVTNAVASGDRIHLRVHGLHAWVPACLGPFCRNANKLGSTIDAEQPDRTERRIRHINKSILQHCGNSLCRSSDR